MPSIGQSKPWACVLTSNVEDDAGALDQSSSVPWPSHRQLIKTLSHYIYAVGSLWRLLRSLWGWRQSATGPVPGHRW